MARYSLALRTTATALGSAAAEFRSASTDRPRIMEIGIFMAATTASTFGIGRPAAIGVTPTSPVTVLANDPAEAAATTTAALAWGTGPTAPTQFLRRISLPGTVGTGVIWTFPTGLVLPVSGSIVVWNLNLNGVADVYVEVDE